MTNSEVLLKVSIVVGVLFFLLLALLLWSKTPNMFEYFNQAFCAH